MNFAGACRGRLLSSCRYAKHTADRLHFATGREEAANPVLVSELQRAGNSGQYFDPWGSNYVVRIDGDYNNQVFNPYTC